MFKDKQIYCSHLNIIVIEKMSLYLQFYTLAQSHQAMPFRSITKTILFVCLCYAMIQDALNMCHSSCATCVNSLINDPTQCNTCTSSYVIYLALATTPGTCIPNPNIVNQQNIQLLQYVSTSTILGNSYLTSISVNGTSSTVNNNIAAIFPTYVVSGQIQYISMSISWTVTLFFQNLGLNHYAIYARVNINNDCNSTQNFLINFDTVQVAHIASTGSSLAQSTLKSHTSGTLNIDLIYGQVGTGCLTKTIQDVTIYIAKCQPYCSNCIDGGKYLQTASSACLTTCLTSQFKQYSSGQYICSPCATGCYSCQTTVSNCSACKNDGGIDYFKQPTANSCGTSCDSLNGYFKQITLNDNQCITCFVGFYGDDTGTGACQSTCTTGCYECFNNGLSSCFSCNGSYFLQPNSGSTVCSLTCPDGYYGYATAHTCLAFSACSSTCGGTCSQQMSQTSCSSCSSSSGFTYLSNSNGQCVPDITDATHPNLQLLQIVDKNTVLGTSFLKNLTVGPNTYSISGSQIGSLAFFYQNIIEFDSLNPSKVTMQFSGIGNDHFGIYVRLSAYSYCSVNNTFNFILAGTSKSVSLTANSQQIVQSQVLPHFLNSFSLTIQFGSYNEVCNKYVQDISIYLQKCQSYCGSCTDSGSLLQYGSTVCSASCAYGTFANSQGTSCIKCSTTCGDCDTISTNCTACGLINGQYYYLDANTHQCVLNCTGGLYESTVSWTCLDCDAGCASCDFIPSNCSSCHYDSASTNNYFLQPASLSCLLKCPTGYFAQSNNKCQKCTNSNYGNWMNGTAAACTLPCNTACLNCFNNGLVSCTSCKNNGVNDFYLQPGTTECSQICPNGYTGSKAIVDDYRCQVLAICSSACATCNMLANPNSCTTCASSLANGLIYLTFGSSGTCTPDISDANYPNIKLLQIIDYSTLIGVSYVKSVKFNSVSHSSISTNIGSILYTQKLIFFQNLATPSVSLSLSGIGFNHYKVYLRLSVSSYCSALDDTLDLTVAGITKHFTAVSTKTYLQTDLLNHTLNSLQIIISFGTLGDACTKAIQDISIYLQYCQDYCSSCPDQGSLLQYGSTTCLQTCQYGTYANSINTQCYKCSSNCGNCQVTSTNCTGCGIVNGVIYYLDGINSANICVRDCGTGLYQIASTFSCATCDIGCYKCDISSSNCSSCIKYLTDLYYKQPGINSCALNSCPSKYFKHIDYTCVYCLNGSFGDGVGGTLNACTLTNCIEGCASCYAANLASCFSCNKDSSNVPFFLQPEYLSNTCSKTCPNAYFGNTTTYQCDKCSSLCKTCDLYAQNCLTCGYFNGIKLYLNISGSTCVSTCPLNSFANNVTGQCQMCTDGCASCFGAGLNSCTQCEMSQNLTAYYKDAVYKRCVSKCDTGQFGQIDNFQCEYCYSYCKTCKYAADNCTSCKNVSSIVYYLYTQNQTYSCLQNCPAGYYGRKSDNQCVQCDSRCSLCTGPGNTSCSACQVDSVTTNTYYLVYSTTECSDICPDGQYADATTFKCLLCDINCQTCQGTKTNCKSCGFTAFGYTVYLSGSTCLQTCPAGRYGESFNNTCQKCALGCATCFQNTTLDCMTCGNDTADPANIIIYYKYINETVCNTICPDGQFKKTGLPHYCQPCSAQCLRCETKSNYCQDATSCAINYFFHSLNNSCLYTCPAGFYANSTTQICELCPNGCLLCQNSSYESCTSCGLDSVGNISYFRSMSAKGGCLQTCPTAQYEQYNGYVCLGCYFTCTECLSDANNCTGCKNVSGVSYYLYSPNGQNECLEFCPDGYYGKKGDNACHVCDSRCSICTGSGNQKCTECQIDPTTNKTNYLYLGTTICSDVCPNGQYANNSDFRCYPCDPNCQTCVTTQTNCLSCGLSDFGFVIYLNGNECMSNCPVGYYEESSNNTCTKCIGGCASCSGPTLLDCQSCTLDLVSNLTYYKFVGFSVCDTQCPTGQFINNSASYSCGQCSITCVACQMQATNCTQASGCNAGLFFNSISNTCVSICPDKYYKNISTSTCELCAEGCAICNGYGNKKCSECEIVSNLTYYYKQMYYSICTQLCPNGYYGFNLTLTCEKCDPSCVLCHNDSITCTQCKNVSGVVYYYYDQQCLQICPNGFYGRKSDNQCVKCDSRCSLCTGPGNTSCSACQVDSVTTNTYTYYLVYSTTECSDVCPDGQYADATIFKCLLCDPNCYTCVSTKSQCTSCFLTSYGTAVFLQGTFCVLTCMIGYYAQTSNHKCTKCQIGCASCIQNSLLDCMTCNNDTTDPNNTLQYYKYVTDTICNTSCPDGSFIKVGSPNKCFACSPQCLKCENTANQCSNLQCATSYFYFTQNSTCLLTCPVGYYGNTTFKMCEKCPDGCTACNNNSMTSCSGCTQDLIANISYFKRINFLGCVQVCSAGQYEQIIGYVCTPCYQTCSQCLLYAEDCTSCKNVSGVVYYLYSPNAQHQCVQTCPNGYYGDKSLNKCFLCDSRCDTCFGTLNNSCTSCQVDNLNVTHYLVYGTNDCSDVCPNGQYANSAQFKCLLCNANCLTCTGLSTNCTSCDLTTEGLKVFLQGNICVQTCSAGFYGQISNHICTICHLGCATCTDNTNLDCMTCKNDTTNALDILVYYKYINQTICNVTCPDGQFIKIGSPNVCQACSVQCLRCAVTSKKCIDNTACSFGYFFYNVNSSCLSACPNGYYANVSTYTCQLCAGGCLLCFGGSFLQCTQCKIDPATNSSYFKMIEYMTCTQNCPDGQYQYASNFSCVTCYQACVKCNSGPFDCQQCKNFTGIVYYQFNNTCNQVCPRGMYGNPYNNYCQDCFQGCAVCSAAGNLSCTTCKISIYTNITYYLQYGTTFCSQLCPDGQYKNGTSYLCGKCDANCYTCVNTATTCTSCFITSTGLMVYLQGNLCVQTCATGHYAEVSNNTCVSCNIGCSSCSGPQLIQCYTCKNTTDANNATVVYYKFINDSTCGLQYCPPGQYINANYPNYCQQCNSACLQCSIKATNCTQSALCAQTYYFYQPSNSCLLICPNGYYANITDGYCRQCVGGCSLCNGPSNIGFCQQCRTDSISGTPYYKQVLTDDCVTSCLDGEWAQLIDHSCKSCHASCILCNTSALDCQQCKNVSGQVYYYYNNQCLIACPAGYWGFNNTNMCVVCNQVCPTCFGPSLQECYSCTIANSTYYYLQFGTTYCDLNCPYGQYEVNSTKSCRLCNQNCASCDITSTNCTTCSYVNTITIVYWHNWVCISGCPNGYWPNPTVQNNNMCTLCHPYCVQCMGPLSNQCQACGNVSTTSNNVTSTVLYYKDLQSTTCASACPIGQFISVVVPNVCVPCNAACIKCSDTSLNCSKCAFGYYLYQLELQCVTQCPIGYFNDPTLTINYYYCTVCAIGCKTCTGLGLTSCQTCTNVTQNLNGTIQTTTYYRHQTYNICQLNCASGYWGDKVINLCSSCQNGCVTCQFNASYCYSCKVYNNTNYYLPLTSNSCVSICPNGSYGNPITLMCQPCIYFSYQGACLQTCPNSTYVDASLNVTICQNCSTTDICTNSYTFKLTTTVVDGGASLMNQVYLPQGLQSSVSKADLMDNLTVYIQVLGSRRRRLLLQTIELSVKDLSISADGYYVFVKTNNLAQTIDLTKASVHVNFKGGVLVSKNGVIYQSTIDAFSLSDPIFMASYYAVYQLDYILMAQGIAYSFLTLVLLIIVMSILNRRTYHELMNFIMVLQCLGIMRMRSYPINIQIYTVLLGFSQYQCSWIPNGFMELYPIGYAQTSLDPVTFALGSHNFINSAGSILQVCILLQICLIIYYIYRNDPEIHLPRVKFLQQALIVFFFVNLIFSCFLSLYSLALNDITSMKMQFLISQFISMVFLIAYLIYLFVWVRPHTVYQLYKIHNFMRCILLVVMITNKFGGLMGLNLLQILFFIIDWWLYRNDKINNKLYIADRVLTLVAFNCAIILQGKNKSMIAFGIVNLGIFAIKAYYVLLAILQWIEQRNRKGVSDLSISDIVHASVLDKGEQLESQSPDQKRYAKRAKLHNTSTQFKLNDSNLIFNQTLDVSKFQEKKQKRNIKKMMSEQSEEPSALKMKDSEYSLQQQQKYEGNQSQSSQSQGQLIVYLDPQDYQKQMKPKKKNQKQQQRSSTRQHNRDALKTGINFHSRRRRHQIEEPDVQIIKIEPNESQIDHKQSQQLSELSDGGWLKQDDKRNVERERNNKIVWKIVDMQNQNEEQKSQKSQKDD